MLKEQIVRIYKIEITQSFGMHENGTQLSLSPYEGDTLYTKGYDDGGSRL